MAIVSIENSGKQSPRWFRKFKKIWINSENAAIVVLLAMGHGEGSLLILAIKTGTSWLLENLETLLADDGQEVDVPTLPSKNQFNQ